MSILETNALLERVLAELGEMNRLLAERLPERAPEAVKPEQAKTVVVTGEGAREGSNPSTTAKRGPGRPRKAG